MKAAIVSGAPHTVLDPLDFKAEQGELLIIGADRGALTLLEHGIVPHLAIGDFDSVTGPELALIESASHEILKFNSEKDETDTEIALAYALSTNVSEIFLYGGLGGRFDHSMANIRLLLRFAKKGVKITLLEIGNHLTVLSPGSYQFSRKKYKYLSFFAMEEEVKGLTLEGVKYPLSESCLSQDDTLCISNEIIQENFSVSFATGFLLMIQSNDF